MTQRAILVAAVFTAFCLLQGCGSMSKTPDVCHVRVPESVKENRSAALEAAANLQQLAQLPVSGNFKTELKDTFEATFSKVPDKDVACELLNQTYACIKDPKRASEYLKFMSETRQCTR